ncbi:MAG TPA: Fe-S protein assembly co-chaperone HscB [Polyangiales bacterium]
MAAASPSPSDAFEVLGLAPAFDLDEKELEQRYRDLQRTLHPDRFAQAPASERRSALSRAVSVNDAYRSLRDELKRGELLFVRLGGTLGETGQLADPELLMEVMELRESLAETKATRDAAKREALTREVQHKRGDATAALREAFAILQDGKNPGALHAAASALSRLRYYRRFLDEVALHEDEE